MRTSLNPDDYAPPRAASAPKPPPLTHADRYLAGRVRSMVSEQIANVQRAVLGGLVDSMEDYRDRIGELRGLAFVLERLAEAERQSSEEPQSAAGAEPLYPV